MIKANPWRWFFAVLLIYLITLAMKCNAQSVVLDYSSFSVEYDTVMMSPRSVWWTVSLSDIGRHKRPSSSRFIGDVRVPGSFKIHDQYTGTGYDRGHMCPSADRSASVTKMRETFVATNICPQAPNCNRRTWLATENTERLLAIRYLTVNVVAGPIYTISSTPAKWCGKLRVPEWFFKCIYGHNPDTIYKIYMIPNE